MTSALPLTAVAICLLLTATISRGAFPELPPFQDPPTDIRHPGKLVWVDLFTEEPGTCRAFYTGLFGWTDETLGAGQDAYTLFRQNDRPVAGMIYRPALKGSTAKGAWLPYFSVDDLSRTLEIARAKGGRVEVPVHDFPDRGKQAIIRDNQQALLGLMRTTDGDPDDYLAEYGEWIWAQLWVRDPDRSIPFYESLLGFVSTVAEPKNEDIYDHLWAANGTYRASLDQIPDSKPNLEPVWLGFIRVEDIEAVLARVQELGGSIYLKPDPELRDGSLAVIRDPAGAAIILIEYEPDTEDR